MPLSFKIKQWKALAVLTSVAVTACGGADLTLSEDANVSSDEQAIKVRPGQKTYCTYVEFRLAGENPAICRCVNTDYANEPGLVREINVVNKRTCKTFESSFDQSGGMSNPEGAGIE